MNILFHIPGLPPTFCAGAEWMAHELIEFLRAKGHTVESLTQRPPSTEAPEKFYERADLVIGQLDTTRAVIDTCKRLNKPAVLLVHNTKTLRSFSVGHGSAKLLVYNSNWLMQHHAPIRIPSMVVNPPIDPYKYSPRVNLVRHSPEGRKILLMNLVLHKGSDIFYQLARLMPERRFVGVKGHYGDQLVESLPNVEILENSAEPWEIYKDCDIVLMPSTMESWGRVGLEAMWAGKPVLASKSTGLCEALGEAADWCERGSLEAWVRSIQLLDEDELYYAWRDRARAHAQRVNAESQVQLEGMANTFEALVSRQHRRLYPVACMPHYLEHCGSAFCAIPPAARGYVIAGGMETYAHAAHMGIPAIMLPVSSTYHRNSIPYWGQPEGSTFLVAGQSDQDMALQFGPVVRMEHGAGQIYSDKTEAFAGGPHHGAITGFMGTGPRCIKAQLDAYPSIPAYAIGCPKLDPYSWYGVPDPGARPILAISFHWSDHTSVPERHGAFEYYRAFMEKWIPKVRDKYIIWGHWHPRAGNWLKPFWKKLGITLVEDLNYILSYAQIYMCDNSSSLFECAALCKSVIFLNAPWYNRGLDLGVRFWEGTALGYQVNIPEEIPEAVECALHGNGAEVTGPRLAQIYTGRPGTWSGKVREALENVTNISPVNKDGLLLVQAINSFADGRWGDRQNGGMVHIGAQFWVTPAQAVQLEKATLAQQIYKHLPGNSGNYTTDREVTLEVIREDVPGEFLVPTLMRYWRNKYGWQNILLPEQSLSATSQSTEIIKSGSAVGSMLPNGISFAELEQQKRFAAQQSQFPVSK